MQPTDYQNIGQYLKESRESLRVTVPEAASALHIRAHYIEALESGNVAEMPGKTYTRGYIRTYAEFLRLDAGKVLEAYAPLLGMKMQELFIPEPTLQQNLPTCRLLWASLAGLLVLYACWYFGIHDRSVLHRVVMDLPPNIAHLLDKPLPMEMDKPWKDCLSDGEPGCYALLRAQSAKPPEWKAYDLTKPDQPPQEP